MNESEEWTVRVDCRTHGRGVYDHMDQLTQLGECARSLDPVGATRAWRGMTCAVVQCGTCRNAALFCPLIARHASGALVMDGHQVFTWKSVDARFK